MHRHVPAPDLAAEQDVAGTRSLASATDTAGRPALLARLRAPLPGTAPGNCLPCPDPCGTGDGSPVSARVPAEYRGAERGRACCEASCKPSPRPSSRFTAAAGQPPCLQRPLTRRITNQRQDATPDRARARQLARRGRITVGRRKGRSAPGRARPAWQKMERGRQVISPALAAHAADNPEARDVIAESGEVWLNAKYVAVVRRYPSGAVMHLSVRRADRKAVRDWRDLQRIKNDIAGPDVEAVELFPAEDRLVDTANQYHLWCMPPGVRLPLGFPQRSVMDAADLPDIGARQRELGE